MNVTKNERGYALIIVLLLIVLITSMSAVFMRGAISNAKQGQRVDKNHLSVVSAEMGVDYYATSFTNRYYEVKDLYWNDAVQRYKSEIEHPDFKGDAKAVAAKYDLELKNKIVLALREVNGQVLPEDVLFEMGPTAFVVNSSANPLLIKGKVTGEYLDGKASVLELNMKFGLPSVLADAGDGGGPPVDESNPKPEIGGGSIVKWPGYTYKPFEIPLVETIPPITVNQESDMMGGLYQNKNVTIRKKTKLNLDSVQGNKGFVSIVSPEDIYTPKLYQNENVEIQTNNNFQTRQIQGNTGYLKIFGKSGIQVGEESFDGNENISISTNGNFQATGGIQSNKGFLNLGATNGFQTTKLYGNHNIDVLTNGKFEVERNVENNNGFLKVKATTGFQSSKLNGNQNVEILTNDSFTTGDVGANTGNTLIKALKKIQISELKSNGPTAIETNSEFQSTLISSNKLGLKIYANGQFQTGTIEHNSNLDIQTNSSFQSGKITTNNPGVIIYTNGDFQSGLIEHNKDIDIHTNKSFQANGINSNKDYIKIYSEGSFQSHAQIHDNKGMTLYSGGSMQVNGILEKNDVKSNIYAKGSFVTDKLQDNHNMSIYLDRNNITGNQTNDGILIKGNFYGNTDSTFFSSGRFKSGLIQNNINLKVVALGDFEASKIFLKENSRICAAKKIILNNQKLSDIGIDSTSAIYVRDSSQANNDKRIFYIDEEQWKEKCSVNLDFPTDEEDKDKPVFVDPGTGGWKRPSIDVKYDPILDSK